MGEKKTRHSRIYISSVNTQKKKDEVDYFRAQKNMKEREKWSILGHQVPISQKVKEEKRKKQGCCSRLD